MANLDVMQGEGLTTSFADISSPAGIDWSILLEAVGTERFEPSLRHILAALVGDRDLCVAFHHEAFVKVVTGCDCSQAVCASRGELQTSPHWVHFTDGPWRAAIAFLLPRSMGWRESSELSRRIASSAGVLAAMLRRHFEILSADASRAMLNLGASSQAGAPRMVFSVTEAGVAAKPDLSPLANLGRIERCLADCTSLPTREREVCSRILHGLSSPAIAADLHLRDSTVKTYRKRAYQRLAIGSERELLNLYLDKWGRWLPLQVQLDAAVATALS